MIDAVAVIVPVHDEEDLLDDCLSSVRAAADAAGVTAEIWVVLDACTDASAGIVHAHDVHPVVVGHRSVGHARGAGLAAALLRFEAVPPERLWTAHTDGDSTVPPHWLTTQLDHAAAGADVVVGTVRPDFRDLSAGQVAAWRATHTPGVANGHVHGANLGIRADALLAAGGFDGIPVHEDVLLVGRMRAAGATIAATDAAWVQTSGRRFGRAPDGYARYLREDLLAAAAHEAVRASGIQSTAPQPRP